MVRMIQLLHASEQVQLEREKGRLLAAKDFFETHQGFWRKKKIKLLSHKIYPTKWILFIFVFPFFFGTSIFFGLCCSRGLSGKIEFCWEIKIYTLFYKYFFHSNIRTKPCNLSNWFWYTTNSWKKFQLSSLHFTRTSAHIHVA